MRKENFLERVMQRVAPKAVAREGNESLQRPPQAIEQKKKREQRERRRDTRPAQRMPRQPHRGIQR